ncbi:MAG: glycosyltransferase family 2 protein [Leptospirales bacterium]|nr:glycosyltransferase family 2 protein [Leptospirales bacterium]
MVARARKQLERNQSVLLSAAIITYNEERRLRECLDSVHGFCDEVLVLDSFSTDATERIAREYSRVRFLRHAFDGHVQQKNRAIELCRGRWVFSLDADERVTPELAQSISKFIQAHPEERGARVRRLNLHMGRRIKHSGWYGARTRLIRKGQGQWGGENPHDALYLAGDRPSQANRSGPILAGDLVHLSFRDLSDQVDTINKFSSIVAFTRASRGKSYRLLAMLLKPPIKFLEIYVFKLGLLDGMPGFSIAMASAFSTFLKWAKLWELQRSGLERPSNLRADYQAQQKPGEAKNVAPVGRRRRAR